MNARGSLPGESGHLWTRRAHFPDDFNSTDNENGSFDDRSDDKGPEPEGLAVGRVGDRTYAFIGLERIGGIVVYDVSDPVEPTLVQYINTRNFSGDPTAVTPEDPAPAGDLAPEGLTFISADDSPTGQPLLAVAFEVSGTTTIFAINEVVAEFDLSHTYCNSTLTGLFNQVTAIPGGTCVLSGATVFDGVRAAPGSTLFIVWSQSRRGDDDLDAFDLATRSPFRQRSTDQLIDTFDIFPTNVFLIKLSYKFLR